MEIIAVTTIWVLFSCFLLFPMLGLPAWMRRMAMTLVCAEFVAVGMWSYGGLEIGRTAASLDVPLLGVGLVALATVRVARTARELSRPSPAPARALEAPEPQRRRLPRRASRRRAAPP